MSKLHRSFPLEKVFEFKAIKQAKSQKDIPTDDNGVPYVVQSTVNNMVARFVNKQYLIDNDEAPVSGNAIVLGVTLPAVSYQKNEFGASQVITARSEHLDEKTGVYLVGVLSKYMEQFSYQRKPGMAIYKAMEVSFPVIENSNPDHEYTVDDIDWQYMRDRITELERDRITELERNRITELDAYLQATGLNDYELTEEDKKILSLSAKRASDEEGTLEDNSEDEVRFGKFVMHDIFEPLIVKKAVKANVRNYQDNEFCVPVVYAKFGDNGIMYWGRKDEFTTYSNVLSIVYNGVIAAGKCYAQEDETGILAESYLIRYKNGEVPFLANLYMSKVIEHKIYPLYSRENLAIWNNRVENEVIELPIKSDGAPDFDYMERYIRAMEKVVIADVVKYKDKVIETTKKVVGE